MSSTFLIILWAVTALLGAGYLLARYLRYRAASDPWDQLSPVARQHIDLLQGGQLNDEALEAAKRRFRRWLENGEVERIRASLRPGTQFVVRVRALAEIGTEEACRILEAQLRQRLTRDPIDQTLYWNDVAHCLRNLNREESLPLILKCADQAINSPPPFSHLFAAETICFLGFGSYAAETQTASGRTALRLLHRALEGMRQGVPPFSVVEGRLGEVIETIWDQRPTVPDPLRTRLFVEVRRFVRRATWLVEAFTDEPFEREAFDLQCSRLQALDAAMEDYLQEAGPALCAQLKRSTRDPRSRAEQSGRRESSAAHVAAQQRDLLLALEDLRADTAGDLLPLLVTPGLVHHELVVRVLRWSTDATVGPKLRAWVAHTMPLERRRTKRLRATLPRRPSVPRGFPYHAVLLALRGHPSLECEQFLLAAAHDWDPTVRAAALSSLGWWEPVNRAEVLLHLQDARHDPNGEVRNFARAALARLGERQALAWFHHALCSDNPQRVREAILRIQQEGLTLLWPHLDKLAESAEPEVALFAREMLEQMQEELEQRRR
jgi:hypothetical protein